MALSHEDEQFAYQLTYQAARVFGNHEQAHRWACYARDSWKIANAIKRGYSVGNKFLKLATLYYYEEDVHHVLVKEGMEESQIQPNFNPYPQVPFPHDQVFPPHDQVPPHGQIPFHGLQVQNMVGNDEEDEEDDEDIKKKLEDR